jgi:deoxyribonuclease I
MQSATHLKNAHQLQWDHIVPAENLGRSFTCWHEPLCIRKNGTPYKGRSCREKISREFRIREAELYNLWPSVGLVNQARSNYSYTNFDTPLTHEFYGCPIDIDKTLRQVKPRDEAKGIVARASLFMSQRYGIPLSPAQKALFETWNKQYPPSTWEKTWAHQVADIEGYSNPYYYAK